MCPTLLWPHGLCLSGSDLKAVYKCIIHFKVLQVLIYQDFSFTFRVFCGLFKKSLSTLFFFFFFKESLIVLLSTFRSSWECFLCLKGKILLLLPVLPSNWLSLLLKRVFFPYSSVISPLSWVKWYYMCVGLLPCIKIWRRQKNQHKSIKALSRHTVWIKVVHLQMKGPQMSE